MDRLLYFLGRTWRQLRSATALNLLSLLTFAISMTILSVYALLFSNLSELTQVWNRRIQIHAYLKDGLKVDDADATRRALLSIPGVREATFISKDEAIREVRSNLGDSASFLEGIESNPFPASFQISLEPRFRHPDRIREIVDRIRRMDGVEDVEYGESWVRKFSSILSILRVGGYLLGVALFIAVVFIVSNTIRLSFLSRMDEISVMKLVGATPTFIKIPFYLEGALLGLAGGLLGLLFAYAFYAATSAKIDVSLFLLLGGERFTFFTPMGLLSILLLSSGLGLLGSALSLARALRY